MDFNATIVDLHLDLTGESRQILRVQWAESQASLPDGPPFFVDVEFVRSACAELELGADATISALMAAEQIAGRPALAALAWHFYHCFAVCPAYEDKAISHWPAAGRPDLLPGMLYALVLMAGLPRMRALHKAHAIPDAVTRDTMRQVTERLDAEHAGRSDWILPPPALRWFWHHIHGELYRLGRLQFQFGVFDGRLRVFRHDQNKQVLALAEAGTPFLHDGQRDGAGRFCDVAGQWVARLTFTGTHVIGHPILPEGRAVATPVQLDRAVWREVLAPGDPVLHVHIPAGGAMDFDQCGASLRQALAFFPKHFPDRPVKAICCGSWILDAQLSDMLTPESNMVRFQREFYLFPLLTADLTTAHRVLKGVPADPDGVACRTSLERAVLNHLREGRLRARAGGGFLLPADFDWGGQVYRKQPLDAANANIIRLTCNHK